MQGERRWGLMTRGEDMEEEEEGGGAVQQAAACGRNVINPSINRCLFMYLFSSPLPVNVVAVRCHRD